MRTKRRPAEYFSFRERIKDRTGGLCEYCLLRIGAELHHRWYDLNAYTGFESPSSVMWVCRPCHRTIHGSVEDVYIEDGSLADAGDRGFDMSWQWKTFLKRKGPH